MVHINSEGKINDVYYLIDGMTMGMPKFLSIYIIENNGKRLMIDVGETLKTRKIVKKLKELNLFPVDIIVLTHSHWDHAQGIKKMHEAMNNPDLEIFASENAIENIKSPEKMIEGFQGVSEVYPFEGVKPLKEGDVIDLNGLELEILNMFGHTMDSIAIYDKKNKTLFAGDSIIMRLDKDAFFIPLMPPDFHEEELLKTFNRLREMKDNLNSIALAHFGIWKDDHFGQILEEMEDSYFKVKKALINWYNENLSMDGITSEYVKTFMPDSKFWNEKIFLFIIDMMISGLRTSGFIK
jgi:glyoxylase-like metal-dependent hydrolase (beta-lactamase superfamily II)